MLDHYFYAIWKVGSFILFLNKLQMARNKSSLIAMVDELNLNSNTTYYRGQLEMGRRNCAGRKYGRYAGFEVLV